jgi:DNA-binding MarR family transcriptional regulator
MPDGSPHAPCPGCRAHGAGRCDAPTVDKTEWTRGDGGLFGRGVREAVAACLAVNGAMHQADIAHVLAIAPTGVARALQWLRACGVASAVPDRLRKVYVNLDPAFPAAAELRALLLALDRAAPVPRVERPLRRRAPRPGGPTGGDPDRLFVTVLASRILGFVAAAGEADIAETAAALVADETAVRQTVFRLERVGVLAGRRAWKRHLVTLNPAFPLHAELRAVLARLERVRRENAPLAADTPRVADRDRWKKTGRRIAPRRRRVTHAASLVALCHPSHARILAALRHRGPSSAPAIAAATGGERHAVAMVAARLARLGLLAETRTRDRFGRRALLYRLADDGWAAALEPLLAEALVAAGYARPEPRALGRVALQPSWPPRDHRGPLLLLAAIADGATDLGDIVRRARTNRAKAVPRLERLVAVGVLDDASTRTVARYRFARNPIAAATEALLRLSAPPLHPDRRRLGTPACPIVVPGGCLDA